MFATVYTIGAKGQPDILIKTKQSSYYISMKTLGFHLLDYDKILRPKPKDREVLQYPELDGEEVGEYSISDNVITREAFDYNIKFCLFNNSEYIPFAHRRPTHLPYSMNKKINDLLDIIEAEKEITLINTFSGFMCYCYYKENKIEEEKRTDFNIKDYSEITLSFRVSKPSRCNFNLQDFYTSVDMLTSPDIVQTVYPHYNISKDYDINKEPAKGIYIE